jgi:glutaredoxin
MAIVFYAKHGCIFCEKLETLLKSLNLPYTKNYISNIGDTNRLKELTNMSSFPMVFIGNEVIGGFTEFNTLYITNQLGKKLISFGINLEEW